MVENTLHHSADCFGKMSRQTSTSPPMSRQGSAVGDTTHFNETALPAAAAQVAAGDVRPDSPSFDERGNPSAALVPSVDVGIHQTSAEPGRCELNPTSFSSTQSESQLCADSNDLPPHVSVSAVPPDAVACDLQPQVTRRDVRLTAEELTLFLQARIDPSVVRPSASGCHFVDVFTLKNSPSVALLTFVERVLMYANCEESCFAVACILIDRVLNESEAHVHDADFAHGGVGTGCPHTGASIRLNKFNVHRFFAAAVMIAIKSTQDFYHPMSYYGAIFGLSAVDVRRLERALMVMLKHRLFVRLTEVTSLVSALQCSPASRD